MKKVRSVKDLAREHGISDATFTIGRLNTVVWSQVRRMKDLEEENSDPGPGLLAGNAGHATQDQG